MAFWTPAVMAVTLGWLLAGAVAAVLLGLTGDVLVRVVTFMDCSNYCHDVFGGE